MPKHLPRLSLTSVNLRRAALGLGLIAASATFLARRERTTGSDIVTAVAGGDYHIYRARLPKFDPDDALTLVASYPRPHGELDSWTANRIILSPDNRLFAIEETEMVTDAVDAVVSLVATHRGELLFLTTDNNHPTTLFHGDWPDAPPLLQAAQQQSDAEWQIALEEFPDMPRPILTGHLNDMAGDGELHVVGWAVNGSLVLRGRTRIFIDYPDNNGGFLAGKEEWWMEVARNSAGQWTQANGGMGTAPPRLAPVPHGARELDITLANDVVHVDGVAQTSLPAIAALDGPYPALASWGRTR